jgi:hypothetical protein
VEPELLHAAGALPTEIAEVVLKSNMIGLATGAPFKSVIVNTILQAGAQPLQFKFKIPFAGSENG